MNPLIKKVKDNKDVAFIAVLTVGLMAVIRSMILAKLGD
ncbi:hypothetical protein M527_04590 [Sphingobium indicum IP26]|nr:hypothetical protein M527_02705 [Sphingobium indicum IP26]EPR11365.1 hypothetical protein M527_04590 [Sphingobium indicum IP26]